MTIFLRNIAKFCWKLLTLFFHVTLFLPLPLEYPHLLPSFSDYSLVWLPLGDPLSLFLFLHWGWTETHFQSVFWSAMTIFAYVFSKAHQLLNTQRRNIFRLFNNNHDSHIAGKVIKSSSTTLLSVTLPLYTFLWFTTLWFYKCYLSNFLILSCFIFSDSPPNCLKINNFYVILHWNCS